MLIKPEGEPTLPALPPESYRRPSTVATTPWGRDPSRVAFGIRQARFETRPGCELAVLNLSQFAESTCRSANSSSVGGHSAALRPGTMPAETARRGSSRRSSDTTNPQTAQRFSLSGGGSFLSHRPSNVTRAAHAALPFVKSVPSLQHAKVVRGAARPRTSSARATVMTTTPAEAIVDHIHPSYRIGELSVLRASSIFNHDIPDTLGPERAPSAHATASAVAQDTWLNEEEQMERAAHYELLSRFLVARKDYRDCLRTPKAGPG